MDIRVLGMMSGSSLDGLDIALTRFSKTVSGISFRLIRAQTIHYPSCLTNKILDAGRISSQELIILNIEYSNWIAGQVNDFLNSNNLSAELIGLHGHTVFHEPENGFSLQLGDGNSIYNGTGIPSVLDFRNLDIANGGQGAPLAPKGDVDLFPGYEHYLNLGGIANITSVAKGRISGYDICPFNLALNEIASLEGHEYDRDGYMARSGTMIQALIKELELLPFYTKSGPKSIDREWYYAQFRPILNKYISKHPAKDILHTIIEHQCHRITEISDLQKNGSKKVLVTGGGAHNSYFIERLKNYCSAEIIIPEKEIVDYKEAIIFAYLALLRVLGKENSIASVTGAKKDSIGGNLYGYFITKF